MPKQNLKNKHSGDTNDHATTTTADCLLNALTQQEMTQLVDALFEVLSLELQEQAIAQLSPDTQKTIQQILTIVPTVEPAQAANAQISLVKQAQVWSELWQEWHGIVGEASEEDGKYCSGSPLGTTVFSHSLEFGAW